MDKLMHFHFIGIGGIGMSALAKILLDNNIKVSGSDVSSSSIIELLKNNKADIYIGHNKENIPEGATVVYNSMINKDNPEFVRALELKCPILHRSELLGKLSKPYKTLAVAGTHGKTTTSSLLATVLKKGGLDPAYAVGGILTEEGINGQSGQGQYFVVEADESDGSFLKYPVYAGIVTNVDDDHLDYFKTLENLHQSFETFMDKIENKDLFFWCCDDEKLSKINPKGIKYGFNSQADLRGFNLRRKGFQSTFDVEFRGFTYKDIEINLPGHHQALNALAVFGLSILLGIKEKDIKDAFKQFKGISRRLEVHCDNHQVMVLDDYAHHPTEIKTTLEGVRKAIGSKRLIAIFQPHRYSRTMMCLKDLGNVFDHADEVIVTDLYSAFEEPIEGINSHLVLKKIQESSNIFSSYVSKDILEEYLIQRIRPHDVVVTLNAGDLCKISRKVGSYFTVNRPQKLKMMLMYGGKSTEHDVSVKSADFIKRSLSDDIYEVTEELVPKTGFVFSQNLINNLISSDIIFPCFHGPFGEDGTIQGFFETLGIAYVGCGLAASSVAMDKVLTKRIALSCNIKTAKFYHYSIGKWQDKKEEILDEVKQNLKFPIFVKPSHLGSSIGLSKVNCFEELSDAIEHAFEYDLDVLVEEGLTGREIEFSVLGNYNPFIAEPGEILTNGHVYDFDAKYGPQGMSAKVPCDLSADLIEKGKELTRQIFEAIGGSGLSRIDYFLDNEGQYWLNEINPIPGFTQISVYPKAMIASGFSPDQLLDQLVISGLQSKRLKDRYLGLQMDVQK